MLSTEGHIGLCMYMMFGVAARDKDIVAAVNMDVGTDKDMVLRSNRLDTADKQSTAGSCFESG